MINEENLHVIVMGGEEVKTPVCILLIGQCYKALQREADTRPPPLCASETASSITAARTLNK